MQKLISIIAIPALLFLSITSHAATNGEYVLDGGVYSINVEFGAGTIEVVEPNKTSVYRQSGASNEYLFTNPTNGATYGLRVVDDKTIQAFKPEPGNVPSTLRLREAAVVGAGPIGAEADHWNAIVERYMELSSSDPDNIQTWAQCGAAALAYTTLGAGQARETALQAAMLLKMISVSTDSSPCPDAIAPDIWASAPAM